MSGLFKPKARHRTSSEHNPLSVGGYGSVAQALSSHELDNIEKTPRGAKKKLLWWVSPTMATHQAGSRWLYVSQSLYVQKRYCNWQVQVYSMVRGVVGGGAPHCYRTDKMHKKQRRGTAPVPCFLVRSTRTRARLFRTLKHSWTQTMQQKQLVALLKQKGTTFLDWAWWQASLEVSWPWTSGIIIFMG